MIILIWKFRIEWTTFLWQIPIEYFENWFSITKYSSPVQWIINVVPKCIGGLQLIVCLCIFHFKNFGWFNSKWIEFYQKLSFIIIIQTSKNWNRAHEKLNIYRPILKYLLSWPITETKCFLEWKKMKLNLILEITADLKLRRNDSINMFLGEQKNIYIYSCLPFYEASHICHRMHCSTWVFVLFWWWAVMSGLEICDMSWAHYFEVLL